MVAKLGPTTRELTQAESDLSPFYNALKKEPGWTYGSVLPLARNDTSGEMSFALPDFLRSTLGGAVDALAGPSTGELTPEALMALADLGSLGSAPAGSLGMLLGRRAATFPHRQADNIIHMIEHPNIPSDMAASVMEKAGFAPSLHGTLQKAEPLPNLRMYAGEPGQTFNLGDILTGADPLFNAYPELETLPINFKNTGSEYIGAYIPSKNEIDINPTFAFRDADNIHAALEAFPANEFNEANSPLLRHELQHWIQNKEGWPSGGNTKMGSIALSNLQTDLEKYLNDPALSNTVMQSMRRRIEDPNAKGYAEPHLKSFQLIDSDPYVQQMMDYLRVLGTNPDDMYRRLIGEQEARAASRMGQESLTPVYDEYADTPPLVPYQSDRYSWSVRPFTHPGGIR